MRRVVSVWLPTWPTDRLRRHRPADMPPQGSPLVTAAHDGRRRMVAAADAAARALGLRPGLPLAQAQALVPGLVVVEADPKGDGAALADLAAWCLRRYTPLTAPDPPNGIWLDVAGCAHLHGGEGAMLADLVGRLARAGLAARAAVADTPGAAWAVARHGGGAETAVTVPQGGAAPILAPLPAAALRLSEDTCAALRRLGLDSIGQLAAAPRAPLARRFGPEVLLRLDQALGCVSEPISPVVPPGTIQRRAVFLEPLITAEALGTALAQLARRVCADLDDAGRGARRLDLYFERVDGSVQAVRAGLARPSRDPSHVARLLAERLGEVDPGHGVEAMHLVVSLAEPLAPAQPAGGLIAADRARDDAADLAPLVDRLLNRLGEGKVFRIAPVESEVPERAVRPVPPLAPPTGAAWPPSLPRPARLLDPPQPVRVTALLPDHPPAAFTWRRVQHRIRHADGPERIVGEWWLRDGAEARAVRRCGARTHPGWRPEAVRRRGSPLRR
jgi:protein ImuB